MNSRDNIMYRIAEFIVDKRKAFLVVFLVAAGFCMLSIGSVGVNDDLTKYLPEWTETRTGVDIMDEEFRTFGRASILVTNTTFEKGLQISKDLKEIYGVNTVDFYDPEDSNYDNKDIESYYKDASAFIIVGFDGEDESDAAQEGIASVREYLSGYDAYIYTEVDQNDQAELAHDVLIIFGVAIVIILLVILFTSKTYMEIPIFLTTFLMAGILNKGTNFIFGEISFISNSVDMILQLALAIDYAIILFHRYMEERDKGQDARESMIESLSKAILEISSSSLTTIAGLLGLVFMSYQLGKDVGIVLCKAIVFSLLTVFFFMPGLIMMFSRQIDKTRHRSFVPSINRWGKLIFKVRYILVLVFMVGLVIMFNAQSHASYTYDRNSTPSPRPTDHVFARQRINQTFDTGSLVAIVVPAGDYSKEAAIVQRLKEYPEVDNINALVNVDVGDDHEYVLTDSLTPSEFAEVADLDVGIARLLYAAYAQDQEAYSAFLDGIDSYRAPIIGMIDFVYDQKEKGAFSLSEEQSEDLDDIHEQIDDARAQLEGENYHRIVFKKKGEVEGKEAFDTIDSVRDMAQAYYRERIYLAGDSTSNEDLKNTFETDNLVISCVTALFVGIILLFTFQSALIPFLLLATIEGSIFTNFGIPYYTGSSIYFLSYLIASSIQMGATIDYAIVITNRYLELRTALPGKKDAIVQSLDN
nr:MMPL family transporter [Lachnospiraceae bacterium]